GHNDALMVAFGIWSFALAGESPLIAGLLVGAACGVKYSAAIAVPFVVAAIWRKHGARDAVLSAAAAGALVVLVFAPFWRGWSTLAPAFSEASFPRTSPTWLIEVALLRYVPGAPPVGAGMTIPQWLTLASVIALTSITVWSVVRFVRDGRAANVWRSIAGLLWAIPNLYPCYVLWISPALSARGAWATFAWWFALLSLVHYAEDVPRLAETTTAYHLTFVTTIVTTLAFLIVPIIIARWTAPRDAVTASARDAGGSV
ncbi:MAG TPA: hypothetical protein VEJ20_10170, partial [Candidatus Eremiobacteraceae bacterium]|nr:hypothetical protein [Candidatus Eremiobacteraceae bacterium]